MEKGKEDEKEVEVSERGDTSRKSQGSEKSKCNKKIVSKRWRERGIVGEKREKDDRRSHENSTVITEQER